MTEGINLKVIKMTALSSRFDLGNLYDYRSDRVLPDERYMEPYQSTLASQIDTEFKLKIRLPNANSSKWEHMGLDVHLQASTLGGLIDKFKGASSYLNDINRPAQATQVIVCDVKGRKESLNVTAFIEPKDRSDKKTLDQSDHIHVVTGIVYGARIFCVLTKDFDPEADEDIKEEVQERLYEFAVKMEESLKESKDVTEFKNEFCKSENQELNRMKCRVYLDVLTPSFRECSFFDAYKYCRKLIEQMKKSPESTKTVPIVYQLCPLKVLNDATSRPTECREVGENLLVRCYNHWTRQEEIRYRVDILKNSTKTKISRHLLTDFATAIKKFQELITKAFKKGVENARRNPDEGDEIMDEILETVENHPLFGVERLERWIEWKMAEAEVLKKLSKLDGIQLIKSLVLLSKELASSFEKKYSLVLSLPSLSKETDHLLLEMKDYLRNYSSLVSVEVDDDTDGDDDIQVPWYKNRSKEREVMNKVQEFSEYVTRQNKITNEVQFFITFDEEIRRCHYSIYKDDNLIKKNAQLPVPPTDVQTCLAKTGTASKAKNVYPLHVEWSSEDIGYPHGFLIEYRPKDSYDSWRQTKTDSNSQTSMVLSCKRDTVLELRVASDTCIGRSEFSSTVDTEFVLDEEEVEQQPSRKDPMLQGVPSTKPYFIAESSKRIVTTSSKEEVYHDSGSEQKLLKPPADLEVDIVTKSTVQLKWSLPADRRDTSITYQVCYWREGQMESSANILNVGLKNGCCLDHLTPQTTYLIHVFAVAKNGHKSDPTPIVYATTVNEEIRFAQTLVNHCKRTGSRNGLDLYVVPLTKSTRSTKKANRMVFGREERKNGSPQKDTDLRQHRTILVVGATGAGKTTLINAMVNYIFNVEWEDPFRFQLIEEAEVGGSQAESQTSLITAYDINHMEGFRIPYSLTIVDTPGYGDTKGLDRDQEITAMVREFFEDKNGIQEIDVVGFVAQASLPRLTPTQSYIFDSVLSIFGSDIEENIDFLLTFADSQIPPILSAITAANLPCPTEPDGKTPVYHKFNNSGFFCSNRESTNGPASTVQKFNQFFWKIGMENFNRFFIMLATMKTKSLSLTKQVLEERKKLEATIEGLQPLIKIGLSKMEEMRKTKLIVDNSQSQIEANENVEFEVEVAVAQKVEIPTGQFLTNCNKCYVTCHFPCAYENDDDKINCAAMDFSMTKDVRSCRICPEKCIWNMHANQPYKWEYVTQKQATSSDAIKRKYETELKRKLTAEELISLLQKDIDRNEKAVLERVDTVASCIKRLDEIALRPNPFSTPQYIDLIIDAEQQEKRLGFKERIASLQKLRKMAIITSSVKNKESLYSLDSENA